MNKTQEKEMVINACNKTVELAKEQYGNWCTDGIIDYLQSIFPKEYHGLITTTIVNSSRQRFELTFTFELEDGDLDTAIYLNDSDLSELLLGSGALSTGEMTDFDYEIKEI